MNDLLASPLGPALILLFASVLLRVFSSPQRAITLAILTLAPLTAAFVLLMVLRAGGVAVYELVWWPLVVPPLRVLWALDGWNWLALALLLITGGCAVLLTWRLPGKRSGAFHGLTFALLGAAALTVVSDNLLALSGAWVATDVLLVARARGSRARSNTAPVWLEAAGSLMMLVAIGITSINVAATSLAAARLPAETTALLMVIAGLRMAAFPLHLWLAPSSLARDRGTQLLINGLGVVTGAWLLGRLYSLGAGVWMANPVWPPVLLALTLLASLVAWAGSRRDRLAMLSSSRATWLWLIVALAPLAAGRDALGWALVSVVLGLALLAVGQSINEQWRWRLPLALAVITLAGVPLTTGMPPRALIQSPNLLLALFIVVADGLAVASVLDSWKPPPSPASSSPTPASPLRTTPVNWPLVRLLTALGLAMVPNLLWGLQPTSLAASADFSLAPTFWQLLAQLGVWRLIAVILALLLGAGFYQLTQQPDTGLRRARERLAAAGGLTWALRGAHWLLLWSAVAWRNALLIVEGEGYLGWIAILLLLALLIVQL